MQIKLKTGRNALQGSSQAHTRRSEGRGNISSSRNQMQSARHEQKLVSGNQNFYKTQGLNLQKSVNSKDGLNSYQAFGHPSNNGWIQNTINVPNSQNVVQGRYNSLENERNRQMQGNHQMAPTNQVSPEGHGGIYMIQNQQTSVKNQKVGEQFISSGEGAINHDQKRNGRSPKSSFMANCNPKQKVVSGGQFRNGMNLKKVFQSNQKKQHISLQQRQRNQMQMVYFFQNQQQQQHLMQSAQSTQSMQSINSAHSIEAISINQNKQNTKMQSGAQQNLWLNIQPNDMMNLPPNSHIKMGPYTTTNANATGPGGSAGRPPLNIVMVNDKDHYSQSTLVQKYQGDQQNDMPPEQATSQSALETEEQHSKRRLISLAQAQQQQILRTAAAGKVLQQQQMQQFHANLSSQQNKQQFTSIDQNQKGHKKGGNDAAQSSFKIMNKQVVNISSTHDQSMPTSTNNGFVINPNLLKYDKVSKSVESNRACNNNLQGNSQSTMVSQYVGPMASNFVGGNQQMKQKLNGSSFVIGQQVNQTQLVGQKCKSSGIQSRMNSQSKKAQNQNNGYMVQEATSARVGNQSKGVVNIKNNKKVSRIISGHPSRRLQQQRQSRSGQMNNNQKNNNVNLTQGSTYRNNIEAEDIFTKKPKVPKSNDRKGSIEGSQSKFKRNGGLQKFSSVNIISQKTSQAYLKENVEEVQNESNNPLKSSYAQNESNMIHSGRGNNQMSDSSINESKRAVPVQAPGSHQMGNIFYHQHPLNEPAPLTINNFDVEKSQQSVQSARPESQKQIKNLQGMNNKNTRMIHNPNKINLPSEQRITQKKNPSRQQYMTQNNNLTNLTSNSNQVRQPMQIHTEQSTSRQRDAKLPPQANALACHFATSSKHPQVNSLNMLQHWQPQSQQIPLHQQQSVNVTNKNSQFNYKKNLNEGRAEEEANAQNQVEQVSQKRMVINTKRQQVKRPSKQYQTQNTNKLSVKQLDHINKPAVNYNTNQGKSGGQGGLQDTFTYGNEQSAKSEERPYLRQTISNDVLEGQSGANCLNIAENLRQNHLNFIVNGKGRNKNEKQRMTNQQVGHNLTSNGPLTSFKNHNHLQPNEQAQQKLHTQPSNPTVQTVSHNNLIANQQNTNKLIKINNSKKILDTARRSRIKQLDNNNNQQQVGRAGLNPLNIGEQKVNQNQQQQVPLKMQKMKQPVKGNLQTRQQVKDKVLSPNRNQPKAQNAQNSNEESPRKGSIRNKVNLNDIQKAELGQKNLSGQETPTNLLICSARSGQGNGLSQNNLATNTYRHQTEVKKSEVLTTANSARDPNQQQISKGQIPMIQQKVFQVLPNHACDPSQKSNKALCRGQIFKQQLKNSSNDSQDKLSNVGESIGNVQNLETIKIINDNKDEKEQHSVTVNSPVKVENQLGNDDSMRNKGAADVSESVKQDDIDNTYFEMTQGLGDTQALSNQNDTNDQNILSNDSIEEQPIIPPMDPQIVSKEKRLEKPQKSNGSNNQPFSGVKVPGQNKISGDQRTTLDTYSNRKVTSDSQQRTNFNMSMQNIPRGIINTAFSLNSVVSRDEIPPLPTTPQNVLKYYIDELTDYEKAEVLDYDLIYFLGKNKKRKVDAKLNSNSDKVNTTKPEESQAANNQSSPTDDAKKTDRDSIENKENKFTHNYGYDDDKGDYKIIMGDHIGFRYEIVEFLGKGSFGTALRCIDHKFKKREVAVKIVKNKKKYYYQASVELKILQYLKQHDTDDIMNVIHIYDYVVFRKHLCMAFELLSMNLFEFLKINDFNGFDHNLIRRFAIQLLYALKYLKQLEIIHCDLKPENILLKEENKSGIKIIDFGSSTFIDEKVYTYIQSRFYRAPEIMLGIPYTPAIDMWSLGCIMAELYLGFPLFPGESENDQMSRIMEMRGVPSGEVLKKSERKMKFFTNNNESGGLDPIMLKNSRGLLRKPNGKPLDYVIGDEDPDFNDFVIRCLDWNPTTRMTPDEALKQVWVLKGLPPQVLIHHQKMHNIATPELPQRVREARDEFIYEQQREQQLLQNQMQQQRINQSQKQSKNQVSARDLSQNPGVVRPQIQLQTPRSNIKTSSVPRASKGNPVNVNSHDKPQGETTKKMNININTVAQEQLGQNKYPGTVNYPGTTKNQTIFEKQSRNNKNGKICFQSQMSKNKQNFNQTGTQIIPKLNDIINIKQQMNTLDNQGQATAGGRIKQTGVTSDGYQNHQAQLVPQHQAQVQGSTRRKFVIKKVNKAD